MSEWVLSGLRRGIRTTRYPSRRETAPGVSPGLPGGGELPRAARERLVALCPTGALLDDGERLEVDPRRCVHCFRCVRATDSPVEWRAGYEWTIGKPALGQAFKRSLHIRVVDAGDCGACLREVKQLAGPYYNLHRLGLFITPTPRQADVLLVVGPGTDQMRQALEKAYRAMPTPRIVIAVGACALTGGVFGPSFVCSGGVGSIIPVDLEVPGQPPPPLAILHALLVATGRAPARDGRVRVPAAVNGQADGDSTVESAT